MAVSFSDIAQLNLNEPDPIDWNQYKESQAAAGPVDDGVYEVQAPDEILFDTWTDKNGRNHLIIANDTKALTISAGPAQGRKLFYPFISTKKYNRSEGNGMLAYVRSFGIDAHPTAPEEYAQLAAATANRLGKVQTKQEAYCRACGVTVAQGQPACSALKQCPTCGGTDLRIAAKVDRFISAFAK